MGILTRHPHAQGVTYTGHWLTAMGIAWRLFRSVIAFAVHANLPFVSIGKHLDLEATAAYLAERNRFISAAARTAQSGTAELSRTPSPAGIAGWFGAAPQADRGTSLVLVLWDFLDALFTALA